MSEKTRQSPNSKCNNLNYFKADYSKIIEELKNVDWSAAFSSCHDVNTSVSVLYNYLREIIARHVPKHKNVKQKYPPWFSYALIKRLSEKDKLRKQYLKYKNPRDLISFEMVQGYCKKLYKFCYAQYIATTEETLTKNPKHFWNFIKNKNKNFSSFPTSVKNEHCVAITGPEIANVFAHQFKSSQSRVNGTDLTTIVNTAAGNKCISNIQISEREVYNKIKQLDSYKGAGPDTIPTVFVKRCGQALTLPLTHIFNQSLSNGVFPDEWKKARVVPLHKKGSQNEAKNYRPITVLSCFSKLFESLVHPQISNHVDPILSSNQHGFRTGHSTITNLTSYVSDLSHELDRGCEVDAIYTDLTSAFDKVNHSLLLIKLEHYGIQGSLLHWFRSYLAKRLHYVVANGFSSYEYNVESGVPQGSHLGPILFSIFVNDVTSVIRHCKCLIFADDLKIYKTIFSHRDSELVQDDLSRIQNWCRYNFMELNPTKCFHIKFTKKKCPIPSYYIMQDTQLVKVNEIKDLGVIVDSKLRFSSHMDSIIKKAARMLGFIKRNTKFFKNTKTKIVIYNAIVRSQLEYGSIIWNPFYSTQSQRIENIQRAFTRHLAFHSSGISHRACYKSRLDFFKMNTLTDRRKIIDIVFLYKLLNSMSHNSDILSQISLNVPHNLPRQPITRTFYIPYVRTNTGFNSPIVRMCSEYNALNVKSPDLDIFSTTLSKFRREALKHLLDKVY